MTLRNLTRKRQGLALLGDLCLFYIFSSCWAENIVTVFRKWFFVLIRKSLAHWINVASLLQDTEVHSWKSQFLKIIVIKTKSAELTLSQLLHSLSLCTLWRIWCLVRWCRWWKDGKLQSLTSMIGHVNQILLKQQQQHTVADVFEHLP